MYRILVVDDERYIADGLRTSLIEELDAEDHEVLSAYSGDQALALFRARPFDIVVSDLRMPGMDGLELQKLVSLESSGCRFIFLTGHDDFDYVRRAFKNQGFDYILKTEGDDRVVASIRRAEGHIDLDRSDKERKVRECLLLDAARRVLTDEAVRRVLAGRLEDASALLGRIAAGDGLGGPGADGRAEPCRTLAGSEENRSYLLALVSLPAGRSGSSGDVPDLISGLLSLCAESLPAGSFWSVLDGHTGFLAARIDRGSPRTKDPRSLTLSFERALEHFGQSAGFGCSIFVSPCPVAFQGLCAEWERLRNLRDLRDGDGLALIMSESSSRGGPDQTLDAVNRFIDSNLSSDVSLTAIADSVGLNPSYLSRWYVQKTGVHLSERVAQVRCDRARELLLQGDSKIAEIAAAVGFWTPSHFIKFFKKRVGATPQEFRGRSAPGSV